MVKNKIALGCCGLKHKNGSYFATLLNETNDFQFLGQIHAETREELINICIGLKIPNYENIREYQENPERFK